MIAIAKLVALYADATQLSDSAANYCKIWKSEKIKPIWQYSSRFRDTVINSA